MRTPKGFLKFVLFLPLYKHTHRWGDNRKRKAWYFRPVTVWIIESVWWSVKAAECNRSCASCFNENRQHSGHCSLKGSVYIISQASKRAKEYLTSSWYFSYWQSIFITSLLFFLWMWRALLLKVDLRWFWVWTSWENI